MFIPAHSYLNYILSWQSAEKKAVTSIKIESIEIMHVLCATRDCDRQLKSSKTTVKTISF